MNPYNIIFCKKVYSRAFLRVQIAFMINTNLFYQKTFAAVLNDKSIFARS